MTKTEFLQVISTQRLKLIEEHQEPGWNMWVLIGAFASLLWLMISILEENVFKLNSSLFLAIFIYIAYNILKPLNRIILNWSSARKSKYISLRREMMNSFSTTLFGLATLIFIYKFIIANATNGPIFQIIFFKIFFYLILIIFVTIFLISYINFPINSNNNSPTIRNKIAIFFTILFLLALNPLFLIYPHLPRFDEYASLKLGLLIFSLHFVTSKLFSTSQRNLLLNQIDELIDDITFDNKNVSEGESTLKLIIYGLQFNTIFSLLINEHLELTKAHKESCDLIIERLKQIKIEDDSKQRKLLEDALSTQVGLLEKTYPLISKNRNKIIKRLSFYRFSEQNNPDYNNIQTLLDDLEKERNSKWQELKNQI